MGLICSFATLHIWWNIEGKLGLSTLNGNLVLNYYQPFDAENSGLCLVGKNSLKQTISTIFEYLESTDQPIRLIHVPEFVIKQLDQPHDFHVEEELDFNEYILDSQALSKLEGSLHGKNRRRVKRFLREVEGRKVEIRELDLSSSKVKEELLEAIIQWEEARPAENDPHRTERLALKRTLSHASHLGIQHLGLYIDDELHAIVLYHQPHDKNYYILHHIKVNYSTPYIFDYITHHVASKAAQEGVDFLNMEMDLGIERLREHKMGLRPVDFFRKYTITRKTERDEY